MEKPTKNKKKIVVLFKIFYIISPQWEHFGTYYKQIQEATVQGYNLHFSLFLDIGHVTNNPTTHYMNPDRYNHSHLIFLWSSWVRFPFWGICIGPWHGPWKQCPIVHIWYVASLFSFWFFWYIFFIWNTWISFFGHLPWTLQTPANNTDYHSYFFHHFFSIFLSYFHPELQIFPYLGMHTGPWKQHPLRPNTITNHPLFLSHFFTILKLFLHLS